MTEKADPTTQTYNWEGVPRKLLDDARAKLKKESPPGTLKWKLIELLTAWTYGPKKGRPFKET
jgi:hypothetical protein